MSVCMPLSPQAGAPGMPYSNAQHSLAGDAGAVMEDPLLLPQRALLDSQGRFNQILQGVAGRGLDEDLGR